MPNQTAVSSSAKDRVAQFAVAQFLLFDATVESLSVLGEHLLNRRKADQDELLEPFRARYQLMRRVLREKRGQTSLSGAKRSGPFSPDK